MKRKNHRTKSSKKSESNQEDYLCELYGLDMIISAGLKKNSQYIA